MRLYGPLEYHDSHVTRSIESSEFNIDNYDDEFLWNSHLIKSLVRFRTQLVGADKDALDKSGILTSMIRGYAETTIVPPSFAPIEANQPGPPATMTIISRSSSRRAGTRFNSRGIDDDGNVANFVETEIIYWFPNKMCFAYTQVRGSVPVFWEQEAGILPTMQKVTITRSKEGTQPAFDKHFEELERAYGAVHIINLLSEDKPSEMELTARYRNGVAHSSLNRRSGGNLRDHQLLRQTDYDFHAETKGTGYHAAVGVRALIEDSADGFAYYLSEEVDDASAAHSEKSLRRTVVVLQQEGIFRTNCLDCLDRTNLVQTILSQMAIEAFLGHRGVYAESQFWQLHGGLWANNGDELSRAYAGTGALKSSYTRHSKMSIAGAFSDATKSVARAFNNNFVDDKKQITIDMLMGRQVGQEPVILYDPINDFVSTELARRAADYTSSKDIRIWVGTFNLNGRTNGINENLSAWLCPEDDPEQQPEVVVVGFQEIVELSPQQIMNSDPSRKQAWERAVKTCLNTHAKKIGSENYVLLRSGQLVGAALCIFVKVSALQEIKGVEGGVKKTGLSGMAGNKGAVAIRMEYASTQLCFVTAHLAAGFANYDERNKDYHTIQSGLRFQRNRSIEDHDTVIWLGDFNYRIGMSADRVKSLIHQEDLETLYANDQLNIQMVAGLTFPHYSESRITFKPTYKFDLGTDNYDSSEKARIPAWTDRILRKGTNIRQDVYTSAPLRFSDHRPVYATFHCTVNIIDDFVKESLSRRLFEKRRSEVGRAAEKSPGNETDEEDVMGYDSIEPGLPPASSDRRKWWLEGGLPARSTIRPPTNGSMPNLGRPPNPWKTSSEPDWVDVPRMPSMRAKPLEASPSAQITPTTSDRLAVNNKIIAGSRKLPPPFAQTDTGPSTLPMTPVPRVGADTPPPQPPRPRQDSATSTQSLTSSTILRKPPPPINKKPLHLTSTPTGGSSVGLSSSQTVFPPPPRRATSITVTNGTHDDTGRSIPSQAPPPPQPRRSGAGSALLRKLPPAQQGVVEKAAEVAREAAPNLPPRPVDLLADEARQIDGWETLQPS